VLVNPEATTGIAKVLHVLGMTNRHWKIINYLSDFYKRTKSIPTVYEAYKENEMELDEFIELFPEGYRRGACLAAGLPFFA